jgi:hypothetical protein
VGAGETGDIASALLTPWWRSRLVDAGQAVAAGGLAATPTLDWGSVAVQALLAEARRGVSAEDDRLLLVRVHDLIAERVRPVYALDESQPASRTLVRGRGSCSQRRAVLEAVARAAGIPIRVRGLLVDGAFWYPRFPRLRFLVPDAVVLAWPEFLLGGEWVSVSELFGPVGSASAGDGFGNTGGETIFEAVARTAVDCDGKTSLSGTCSACDLSSLVLRDLGRYDSRDALFARHGQTLCRPARLLAGPSSGIVVPPDGTPSTGRPQPRRVRDSYRSQTPARVSDQM